MAEFSDLWAKADDVMRWRKQLHELRALTDGLLEDLGDLKCFKFEAVDFDSSVANGEPEAVVKEPKRSQPQPKAELAPSLKQTRVSFPNLFRKISEDHGEGVAEYAVKQLCGSSRTATRLKDAMDTFLGTYPTQVDAAHAFAESEGQLGLSGEEAISYLKNAHHKVTDQDGRVGVWANRKGAKKGGLKNDPAPSATDASHAWSEVVAKAKEAKEQGKEQPLPKRKRKPKSVAVAPPVPPKKTEADPQPEPVKQAEQETSPVEASEPDNFDDFLSEPEQEIEAQTGD